MSERFVVDPPQLDLLLKQLRLPTMRTLWRSFSERAEREGWPAARLLAALASQEVTDRERRRFERHRAEAKLPPGKTLDNFDFTLVPAVSKARVGVLASGDTWLEEGANVLLFGPPGTGKSHLAAGQASPYLYPSRNPLATAPSRLAMLAVPQRWPTPQVRAAGRRMPTVSLTPPSPIRLLRVPQTAIVFPLVASRPLVLTLIVATFSS